MQAGTLTSRASRLPPFLHAYPHPLHTRAPTAPPRQYHIEARSASSFPPAALLPYLEELGKKSAHPTPSHVEERLTQRRSDMAHHSLAARLS